MGYDGGSVNTLKEVLRIVNERETARGELEKAKREVVYGNDLLQRVLKFGETIDPEFRTKCLEHLDNEDSNNGPFGVWKIMNRDLWKRLGLSDPGYKHFSYVGSPKADDGV